MLRAKVFDIIIILIILIGLPIEIQPLLAKQTFGLLRQ